MLSWSEVILRRAIFFFSPWLLLTVHLECAELPVRKATNLIAVSASAPRGYFENAFSLALSTAEAGSVIRYTLNGSEPTAKSGLVYQEPMAVTNTTLLRAAAFREEKQISEVATWSYLRLDSILQQSANPPGFPSGPSAWSGRPSVYGMNPGSLDNPAERQKLVQALKSLPILSLVGRMEDFFGRTEGIYLHTLQKGEAWERPCSVELVLPEEGGFQINCGVRIQGNMNRVPEKSPKHSFRLLFKEKYGPGKLNFPLFPDSPVKKFDTLVLRADFNNSWIHWNSEAQPRAQRIRDAWLKDSHRAMGWVDGHNRYLHLFLNGLYWGIYDAAERPDASFAAAYLGGAREDYDVVNEMEVKGGNLEAFQQMLSIRGLAGREGYEKLLARLDMTNYIDYLLLNYFAGNQDWGEQKNWYVIRRRNPPGKFLHFVWDGERILEGLEDDTVSDPFEQPFRMAEELKRNPEFKIAFADRVQKHLFEGGALTPEAAGARWLKRVNEVYAALPAEAARWGYYRRKPPYHRDREWLQEHQRLVKNYFPKRTAVVLQQLKQVGLYPNVNPPVLTLQKISGASHPQLSADFKEGVEIFFTTDGRDPRLEWSGSVQEGAIRLLKLVPISVSGTVKARARKSGQWSALVDLTLLDKRN